MILEVLVSSTPTDKTFFYKEGFSKADKPIEGQLVKLKFRKKDQIGLILKRHKKLKLNFKLLQISNPLEGIIFTNEIIKSMSFFCQTTLVFHYL